jgi:hypothetical protein
MEVDLAGGADVHGTRSPVPSTSTATVMVRFTGRPPCTCRWVNIALLPDRYRVGGLMTEDGERFDALYREHYDAVERYVRRRVDDAVTGDVVAEIFTVAWRRIREVPRVDTQ